MIDGRSAHLRWLIRPVWPLLIAIVLALAATLSVYTAMKIGESRGVTIKSDHDEPALNAALLADALGIPNLQVGNVLLDQIAFSATRDGDLAMHPTVKPVALVALHYHFAMRQSCWPRSHSRRSTVNTRPRC